MREKDRELPSEFHGDPLPDRVGFDIASSWGEARKCVLSGIQPAAEMHIGNYFGAVRNWARLQDHTDGAYGVVDLHAMTVPYDPVTLWQKTREMFLSLMAAGIDPDRSLMLVQLILALSQQARAYAARTLEEVREVTGVAPPRR